MSSAYCDPWGVSFRDAFAQVHGYIALVICLLGSVANSVNIAVLSRKEMASSTNSILTGLAVADLLVMIDYIPFAFLIYVKVGTEQSRNSYAAAVFVYFHSIFSQTFHTVSIWLTITLAIWRYIAIKFPQMNRTFCNKRNTNAAIALAYIVSPILCLPIYFAMNIGAVPPSGASANVTMDNSSDANVTLSRVEPESKYAITMTTNQNLLTAIFWIYSVFIKLIPCIVLSILSVCLIVKMKSSDRRRQKLLKKSAITTNEERPHLEPFIRDCYPYLQSRGNKNDEGLQMSPKHVGPFLTNSQKARLNEDGGKHKSHGGGGRTDRTTRMLLALLGLFLATELPQALFGLLTATAPHLFQLCYYTFGEVMDLMALVGSAINFVLYCSMSRQFRSTFTRLARKLLPLPTPAEPDAAPLTARKA